MTDDQIIGSVVGWLSSRTAIPVIRSHQSGPEPTKPYIVVNYTGSDEVRVHEQDIEYEEDVASGRTLATPVIETEFKFSLHGYSETPTDLLRPLRSAAKLAQVNEPLIPGLIIHETSEIRNVPDYVNEDWEPRAQMDLFVRGLVRDGHLIDSIEQYTFIWLRRSP